MWNTGDQMEKGKVNFSIRNDRLQALVVLLVFMLVIGTMIVGFTFLYNVLIQPIYGGPILSPIQGASILAMLALMRMFLR